MQRTLSSTNTAIDGIDPDHEDAYVTAVNTALAHADRESYSLDGIGQKEYHIALVPYTDPIQEGPRFAVYYTDPAQTEITDHATHLDAEREYENLVVAGMENFGGEYDEDGVEIPAFEVTDVDPTVVAAHRAAERAEVDRQAAQAEADRKAVLRAVAVADLVDSIGGRGAATEASRRLDVSKPVVSDLLKKAAAYRAGQPGPIHYAIEASDDGEVWMLETDEAFGNEDDAEAAPAECAQAILDNRLVDLGGDRPGHLRVRVWRTADDRDAGLPAIATASA